MIIFLVMPCVNLQMMARSSVSFLTATSKNLLRQSVHQRIGTQLWPDVLVPRPHSIRFDYDGQLPTQRVGEDEDMAATGAGGDDEGELGLSESEREDEGRSGDDQDEEEGGDDDSVGNEDATEERDGHEESSGPALDSASENVRASDATIRNSRTDEHDVGVGPDAGDRRNLDSAPSPSPPPSPRRDPPSPQSPDGNVISGHHQPTGGHFQTAQSEIEALFASPPDDPLRQPLRSDSVVLTSSPDVPPPRRSVEEPDDLVLLESPPVASESRRSRLSDYGILISPPRSTPGVDLTAGPDERVPCTHPGPGLGGNEDPTARVEESPARRPRTRSLLEVQSAQSEVVPGPAQPDVLNPGLPSSPADSPPRDQHDATARPPDAAAPAQPPGPNAGPPCPPALPPRAVDHDQTARSESGRASLARSLFRAPSAPAALASSSAGPPAGRTSQPPRLLIEDMQTELTALAATFTPEQRSEMDKVRMDLVTTTPEPSGQSMLERIKEYQETLRILKSDGVMASGDRVKMIILLHVSVDNLLSELPPITATERIYLDHIRDMNRTHQFALDNAKDVIIDLDGIDDGELTSRIERAEQAANEYRETVEAARRARGEAEAAATSGG